MDKARSVSDPDFRVKAYHRILDTIQEDHPWIPLYVPLQVFAVREHVKGFVKNWKSTLFNSKEKLWREERAINAAVMTTKIS